MRGRSAPPSKYIPLVNWLLALPESQQTATLTVVEIETMTGGPIPASAWTTLYWTKSTTAVHNWQRAGFRAQLDRLERQVVFTRRSA